MHLWHTLSNWASLFAALSAQMAVISERLSSALGLHEGDGVLAAEQKVGEDAKSRAVACFWIMPGH